MTTFSSEQLNFFKFSTIVHDEFPVALRQVFVNMWDNQVAPTPGFQKWDDSPLVRNMFLKMEGGKKIVPTSKSFHEWSCVHLIHATLFANSFALPSKIGEFATLHQLFVRPLWLPSGQFHSSVISPSGNPAETFALALDQLRLLRNTLCHQNGAHIDEVTFQHYILLTKDAFSALGLSFKKIDDIAKQSVEAILTGNVGSVGPEVKTAVTDTDDDIKNTVQTGISKEKQSMPNELGEDNGEQDRNQRKIHEETVTSEGTHWDLKEGAVHFTFPPNAVSLPTSIAVYKWNCSASSPPLQEHEAIVSNVIEISMKVGQALQFNGDVKLFLSHSAPDLRGYELVVKRQTDKKSDTWKDMDGTEDLRHPSDIEDDYPSLKDIPDFFFPVAQVDITECSTYAVVCRLKLSPSYTVTSNGGTFNHPGYPSVTVTIPKKAVKRKAKFSLELKVQEIPKCGEFEGQDVFIGPLLRIICSQTVRFLKPITIQLPVSLRGEREGIPNLSTCRVRVLYLKSEGEHREWVEFTGALINPANFDGTSVWFNVPHFSGYLPVLDWGKIEFNISRLKRYMSSLIWNPPRLADFIASFEPSDNPPTKGILYLTCCPAELRSPVMEEQRKNNRKPSVVTSKEYLVPGYDRAFVFLSGRIYHEEDVKTFSLRFEKNSPYDDELKIYLINDHDLSPRVEFRSTPEAVGENLLATIVSILNFDRPALEKQPANKSPETASVPPEVTVTLLKTEDLPKNSKPWGDIQLPVDILLLAVKNCEFLACLSYLNPGFFKSYTKALGYVYLGDMDEGKLKLRIAVMKCHTGSTCLGSSAVVVKDAVRALMPKAVFCVGFCGGLNFNKVKLGDVVVLEKLITYAPSKVTENGIEERGVKVPLNPLLSRLTLSPDEGWKAPLKDPKDLNVQVHRGTFLSGPEVVDSNERSKALIKRFPEAVAIETEVEGLYAAAHDLDVEWIVIKGVSDYADGRKSEKDSWRQFASLMAASLTAHILSDHIVFQDWPHYESASEFVNQRRYEQAARVLPSTSLQDSVPHSEDKPSDKVLNKLSRGICTFWESVGRELEVPQGKIDEISVSSLYPTPPDKAFQMLNAWKNRGKSVTYDELCRALKEHDLNELAESLRTF